MTLAFRSVTVGTRVPTPRTQISARASSTGDTPLSRSYRDFRCRETDALDSMLARSVANRLVTPDLSIERHQARGASSAIVQRQKAPGRYEVTKKANLRDVKSRQYATIRELDVGTKVDVKDNGERQSKFQAGFWDDNEHSWSLWLHQYGWIEDSKLRPDTSLQPQPPQQPQQQQPQQPQPEPEPQGLTRIYPLLECSASDPDRVAKQATNHWVQELLERGRSKGMTLQPLSNEVELEAISKINKSLGGGGGDYGKAIIAQVPKLVRLANQLRYPIDQSTVRDALSNVAVHSTGLGSSTQIGEFRGEWSGGAFFNFKDSKK